MLSSMPQPLRAHSSTTSPTRCICGPSNLSRNPPCGFQLLEPPLPFLVLLVPQDCVQYLGRVRMQLGPFFAGSWIKLLIHHHLTRHCKALLKLVDYLGPKLVLVPLGPFHYAWSPLSAIFLESRSSASCASLLTPHRAGRFPQLLPSISNTISFLVGRQANIPALRVPSRSPRVFQNTRDNGRSRLAATG